MIEFLREISHWIVSFADSEWAVAVLAISSFTESIFNPFPPDPLLIGIAIRQPHNALWLAGLVTISSVLGALVGHWLGQKLGRPVAHKFISPKKIDAVERMFHKYGVWAILLAAFTPLPYKVFAVTAGILDMERKGFIIASLIGRGARFLIIGALILVFGEAIEVFIEEQFEILTIGFSIALVVALAVVFFVMRRRRANNRVNQFSLNDSNS